MASIAAAGVKRETAEIAVAVLMATALTSIGQTPVSYFPSKGQIRKNAMKAYTDALNALAADLTKVGAGLTLQQGTGVTNAQTILDVTAALGVMTGLRDALQGTANANAITIAAKVVSIDSTLTAICAGQEAAVLIVIAAMTNVAALTAMQAIETAGSNRANVTTAIGNRITALG